MGIFDFLAPQQGQGGILGPQINPTLGILASSLQDAGAQFAGRPSPGMLQSYLVQQQGNQARQQILSALNSNDPAARQQAYSAAALMGIDTKPFQQQQAASALPKLLQSMQPTPEVGTVTAPSVSANLPQLGATLNVPAMSANFDTGNMKPGLGLSDALAQSGSPELQAQYAPEIIKQLMKPADNTPHQGINPSTHALGQYVLKDGVPQWLDVGVVPKAPTTRTIKQGTLDINQEFDPLSSTWKEVGRGTAFKPDKEVVAPDPKAVDLGVQYFMEYGKLPPTARNPAMQGAIMAAASDRLAAQGKTMQDVIRTAQTNTAAGQTVTAFDKGKQGDTVRSLNVSVQHLDTLRELGKALKNGDINLINAARQKFAEAFGGAAPTNWDAAKAIVADEVAKGVIGGQTAQSDRETLAATLKNSRSPEQAEGAINTFQDLLGGQLRGLRQQYKSSTGRDDFNSKLFPETVRRLDPVKPPPNPSQIPQLPQKPATQKIRVFNPATGRLE